MPRSAGRGGAQSAWWHLDRTLETVLPSGDRMPALVGVFVGVVVLVTTILLVWPRRDASAPDVSVGASAVAPAPRDLDVRVLGFLRNAPRERTHDVWPVGGSFPAYLPTVTPMRLASSHADDAPDGRGAAWVEVTGLDGGLRWKRAVVHLDGTEDVAVHGFRHVNHLRAGGFGDAGTNVGDLRLRVADDSPVEAGRLQSLVRSKAVASMMARYIVPQGFIATLEQFQVSLDQVRGHAMAGTLPVQLTLRVNNEPVTRLGVTLNAGFKTVDVLETVGAGDAITVSAASPIDGADVTTTFRVVLQSVPIESM